MKNVLRICKNDLNRVFSSVVAVKAVLGPVIADLPDDLAGNLGDIHIAAGADLAHDVDKAGGNGGFAGHAALGVLLQDGVQHSVGNLVADLIGMPLGNGFGSKEIVAHIFIVLSLCTIHCPIAWEK